MFQVFYKKWMEKNEKRHNSGGNDAYNICYFLLHYPLILQPNYFYVIISVNLIFSFLLPFNFYPQSWRITAYYLSK